MIKAILRYKIDSAIALIMPMLLLTMTVTHSPIYLYVILILCVLKIRKPVVIFPVYFIASLSTAYFAIGEGTSAGRYLSLLMIMSLVMNVFTKGINAEMNKYKTIWFVLVFYCLLSALTSVTGTLIPFVMLIQGLLVLFLLPQLRNVDVEYFCSLLFFACLIAIIGVWLQFVSIGIDQLLNERYRGSEGETNSNRIAMMVMQIALVTISPFLANEKSKIVRLTSIVGFIFSIVIIVLTGSRTSLVSTIGAFAIMFSAILTQNIRKYIIPAIIVLCIGIVFFHEFSQIDSVVLDRFSLQVLEDSGGSDRMPAIRIFLDNIFPEYPLFGVGLGGENFNAIASKYGMNHPCHNIVFDPLAQLGLIGFFIFIIFCIKVFMNTWRCFKMVSFKFPLIISLILVIGAVINGIGETVYLEKWFWNALGLCLFCITNKEKLIKWESINR